MNLDLNKYPNRLKTEKGRKTTAGIEATSPRSLTTEDCESGSSANLVADLSRESQS